MRIEDARKALFAAFKNKAKRIQFRGATSRVGGRVEHGGRAEFTFAAQASAYRDLFAELGVGKRVAA